MIRCQSSRLIRLFVLALIVATALLSRAAPATASPHAQINILAQNEIASENFLVINNQGFAPAAITVEVGQSVTWRNVTTTTQTLKSGRPPANPGGAVGLIFLPLVQGQTTSASQATESVATSANVRQAPDDFEVTLAPNQDFTLAFDALGAYPFYLVNSPQATGQINVIGKQPTTIARTSPANGEGDVAVTRETFVEFSHALSAGAPPAAAVRAEFGGQTLAARLNLSADRTRITLFYSEPLPASAQVRVTVDGSQLTDGDGNQVDADGDGQPGGQTTFNFTTLSLTTLPGTRVCGRVFASELSVTASGVAVDSPLQGVTITVDGQENTLRTTTDNLGNFCLDPAPAGRFFVHVDGRTASNGVSAGTYYPFVGKAWDSIPGQETNVGNIYLPLVPNGTLQAVSNNAETDIGFAPAVIANNPGFEDVQLVVPADSLFADNGTRGGQVGIAPVPPDRLPGQLPPELKFPIVITVQTDGATNFDKPAPVCFPNLPDKDTGQPLPAGSKSALWSFNHDTGRFGIVGPMTVSLDGKLVCTDPGVGIEAPGWHGTQPGTATKLDPKKPTCDSLETISKVGNLGKDVFFLVAEFVPVLKQFRCYVSVANTAIQTINDLRHAVERKSISCFALGVLKSQLNNIASTISACVPAIDAIDKLKTVCDRASKLASALSSGGELAACIDPSTFDESKAWLKTLKDYITSATNIKKRLAGWVDPKRQLLDVSNQLLQKLDNLACGTGIVTASGDVEIPLDAETIALINEYTDLLESQLNASLQLTETAVTEFASLGDKLALATQSIEQDILSQATEDIHHTIFSAVEYGNTLLRQVSQGGLVLTLPADTAVKITLFDPIDNTLSTADVHTNLSGLTTDLGGFVLGSLDGLSDTDEDGLVDEAEYVVGTKPDNPDTDGDGISDGAEVQQGANPLDGLAAQTGIIATADTPGAAVDVCAFNDSVVAVADSQAGVAIFNVFNGMNPSIIGQVDTPGSAQAVACTTDRVVVADGNGGVTIIDMRDPANAVVERRVALNTAQAVAALTDRAYVASGEDLVVIDLGAGDVIDRLSLAGPIQDVSFGGNFLYALTTSQLHTLPLGQDTLTVVNSVDSPGLVGAGRRRWRLFVGDRTLYATHNRGYNTFDLAEPARPKLITASSTNQIGWKQLVTNGTGLGIAAVGPNSTDDGPHNISLYDVSDPRQTDRFLTQFTTPGLAAAVTLYNGLAFVADSQAGLQVINYLSYDSQGNPPTIALTSNFAPGVAEEGAAIAVSAVISDDVQVRNVEFFLDGQSIAVDGDFPFEARFVTPRRSEQASFTLRAVATDTGGNRADTGDQTITLVADATPPRLVSVDPPDGELVEAGQRNSISVTFNEPMDPANLTTAALQVFSAGVDGILGTADDALLGNGAVAYDSATNTATLTFATPFAAQRYRAVVAQSVTDAGGNPLNDGFTWTFQAVPAIAIGDAVNDSIGVAFEKDIFRFSATANQQVFFDLFDVAADLAQINWRVVAPDGAVIFDRIFNCCGGSDPGVYTLPQAGVYTIVVGDDRDAETGAYSFKLWNVPPADTFAIAVGDTISNGVPGPGAGNIESPGVKDLYTFNGAAGQQVYFDLFNVAAELVQVNWRATAPDGTVLFDRIFNCCGGSDPGVYTLPQAGVYTIQVGDDRDDATGAYAFTLWNAPPADEFNISIGDTISNGVPGPGAGNIESPGVKDIYALSATAGQQVFFDVSNVAAGLTQVNWRVNAPDGSVIFDRIFNCCGGSDPGVYTLPQAGVYTITVGDDLNAGTGTYAFTLWNVPPAQRFNISIGDTVSNGVPAAGAGNIETPGARDIYTFNATAGQSLFFDLSNVAAPLTRVRWRLEAPDGAVVFNRILNSDPGAFTLTQSGVYTITVGDDQAAGTGDYQFQISAQ